MKPKTLAWLLSLALWLALGQYGLSTARLGESRNSYGVLDDTVRPYLVARLPLAGVGVGDWVPPTDPAHTKYGYVHRRQKHKRRGQPPPLWLQTLVCRVLFTVQRVAAVFTYTVLYTKAVLLYTKAVLTYCVLYTKAVLIYTVLYTKLLYHLTVLCVRIATVLLHARLLLPFTFLCLRILLPILWAKACKQARKAHRSLCQYLRSAILATLVVMAGYGASVIEMLLMLSGDVERNPGPSMATTLFTALSPARSKWHDIGFCLCSWSDVLVIEADHQDDGIRLQKVIISWLKQQEPRPTWESLIDVLRAVDENQLADDIERRFVTGPDAQPLEPSFSDEEEKEEEEEEEVEGLSSTAHEVIKAVWEARVKWQEIGILLELPLADLRAIEKNYRYCDQRFQRMISMWLTQCNPQHIWKSLIAALKSPMVAWDRVAHDIERKYVADFESMEQQSSDSAGAVDSVDTTSPSPAPSLGTVIEAAWETTREWRDVGLQLGLCISDLDAIEREYVRDEECYREMMRKWLHAQECEPKVIWRSLGSALRWVGRVDLAHQLVTKCFAEEERERELEQQQNKDEVDFSDATLTEREFMKVYRVLYGVQHKWKPIGLALGLKSTDISHIEDIHTHRNYSRCLQAVLTLWLNDQDLKPTWWSLIAALRTVDLEGTARDIEQKAAKQMYEEALKGGYVMLRIALCILIGAAGGGKTCVKHLLLKLDPPPKRVSTDVTEPPVRAISVDRASMDGSKDWKVVTPAEFDDKVLGTIKRKDYLSPISSTVPGSPPTQPSATTNVRPVSEQSPAVVYEENPTNPKKQRLEPLPHEEPLANANKESTEEFVHQQTLTAVQKELVQSLTRASEEVLKSDWVYLLDTGGQPQFQEILPAFVQRALAFFFVTKLNEEFSNCPKIEYWSEGEIIGEETTSLTNEQFLKRYFRVMQSRCLDKDKGNGPSVFFIGTHKDRVDPHLLASTIKDKNGQLRQMLGDQFEDNLGFYDLRTDQLIYPVNAERPSPEDHAVAGKLREHFGKLFDQIEPEKVPLTWFLFEHYLRKLASEKDVRVLSVGECQVIGRTELRMNHVQCHAALLHLSGLNILFYDQKSEVVFLSSQVLVSMVSLLVRISYALRGGKDSGFLEGLGLNRGIWNRFRDYGLLTVDHLNSLEEVLKSNYRDGIFGLNDFLKLLKRLQLVFLFGEDTQTSPASEYIMPCVLPELPPSEIPQYRQLASPGSSPLLIYYPDMQLLPAGIFIILIACLQNKFGWKLRQSRGKVCPELLRRNCVKFDLPKALKARGSVTLIDSFAGYLEVHVKLFSAAPCEACCEISKDVFEGLKSAAQVLGYGDLKPQPGFFCQGGETCPQELHLAEIIGSDWQCTHDPDYGGSLDEERHKCWPIGCDQASGSSSSAPAMAPPPAGRLGSTPLLREFTHLSNPSRTKSVQIITQMQAEWPKLVDFLELPTADVTVQNLKAERDYSPQSACRKVFSRWLDSGDQSRMPKEWNTVLEVVSDMGNQRLSDDIRSVLTTP